MNKLRCCDKNKKVGTEFNHLTKCILYAELNLPSNLYLFDTITNPELNFRGQWCVIIENNMCNAYFQSFCFPFFFLIYLTFPCQPLLACLLHAVYTKGAAERISGHSAHRWFIMCFSGCIIKLIPFCNQDVIYVCQCTCTLLLNLRSSRTSEQGIDTYTIGMCHNSDYLQH